MAAFHFKYQTIEDIKGQIKKNTEKEYSLILKEIERVKEEINSLKKQIEETYELKHNMNAKELIFLNQYRETLKNKILLKEEVTGNLELKKKEKLEELTKHHQEHKVFEKLHEKHHENFKVDEARNDLKNIDDLSSQKFTRKMNES